MNALRISEAARETGLSAHTIRFYERQGLLLGPGRSEAGYRLYGPADLRRMRLAHNLRELGVPLARVKSVLDDAFASDCGHYARQLLGVVAEQQDVVQRRMAELQRVSAELDAIATEARALTTTAPRGQQVAECTCCLLVDGRSAGDQLCPPAPGKPPLPKADAWVDAIDVLACEIELRPASAPGPDELLPFLRELNRGDSSLDLVFDLKATDLVASFADAERRCCSSVPWEVDHHDDAVVLRLVASPGQLDAFQAVWQAPSTGQA